MTSSSGITRGLSARAAVIGLLLALVPMASWAHSATTNSSTTCFPGFVCISNQGGTAVGGVTGLVMDGSGGSLVSNVIGIGTTSVTGSLSFTTGAFSSTSFGTGICAAPPCTLGTFGSGTLSITVQNWNGFSGTLFTGTFGGASGITWQYEGKVGSSYLYELSGPISGTWLNGSTVAGQTAQLFFSTKTPYKGGKVTLTSGTTSIVTPEPTSVGLLGAGLVCMGLLVRTRGKQLLRQV